MSEEWQLSLNMADDETQRLLEEEKAREFVERLTLAKVPESYWQASSSIIPDEYGYKQKVSTYLHNLRNDLADGEEPNGLYLYGPVGSGKTAIACALLKWFVPFRSISFLFLPYDKLIETSKENAQFANSEGGYWDAAYSFKVLVIDDILKRHEGNSSDTYRLSLLDDLLRTRIANKKVTILTGNYSLEEIFKIDERLHNVLIQNGYDLQVIGTDFRALKRQIRPPL